MRGLLNNSGFTVWFTGLPGAGKTTLAKSLEREIKQQGFPVELFDGDEMRRHLTKGLGFTREDREENVRRIAYVAGIVTRLGGVAIVAAISPYANSRQAARDEIGNFVEVFVRCPLSVCAERDPKGLYAKAHRGEIMHFTGVSDPYEDPRKPEVIVDTNQDFPQQSLEKIVGHLHSNYLLPQLSRW